MTGKLLCYLATPASFLFAGFVAIILSVLLHNYPYAPLLHVAAGLLFGIPIEQLWHHNTIEKQRQSERLELIEQFNDIRSAGLSKILPHRDTDCENKGFDFFVRVEKADPKHSIVLYGVASRHLAEKECEPQLVDLLLTRSKLVLKVIILEPESPYAAIRSEEVHGSAEKTPASIAAARSGWLNLARQFPGRIHLYSSKAIPYGEYHAMDHERRNGVIYYTPISYGQHSSHAPAFWLTRRAPEPFLYTNHSKILQTLLGKATEVHSAPS